MLQISNLGSWNNGYKVMTSGNVCNYLPMEINKVAILVHKVEIYSVIPAKNALAATSAARKAFKGSRWNQGDNKWETMPIS